MKLFDVFFLDLGASRLRGRTLATFREYMGGEGERKKGSGIEEGGRERK